MVSGLVVLAAQLALLVGPSSITLGEDKTVHFQSPALAGEPPPRVFVNVGTVEAPVREGNGYRIDYHPPARRVPQILIIAAVRTEGIEWTALPLIGQGVVTARTEPRATVRVVVGNETFGPFRADAKGEAKVKVRATPGATQAKTIARDQAGNVTEAPLELKVPPYSRVLALCLPTGLVVLTADGRGASSTAEEITATYEDGSKVALTRDDTSFVSRGAWKGHKRVEIRLAGDDGPGGRCDAPPPATGIAVRLARPFHVAGQGPVEVTISPLPANSLPIDVKAIEITSTAGSIDALQAAQENFTAEWSLPELFEKSNATVRARLRGQREWTSASIELWEGPVARLEVNEKLEVKAFDTYGNRVATPNLSVERRKDRDGTHVTFSVRETPLTVTRDVKK